MLMIVFVAMFIGLLQGLFERFLLLFLILVCFFSFSPGRRVTVPPSAQHRGNQPEPPIAWVPGHSFSALGR